MSIEALVPVTAKKLITMVETYDQHVGATIRADRDKWFEKEALILTTDRRFFGLFPPVFKSPLSFEEVKKYYANEYVHCLYWLEEHDKFVARVKSWADIAPHGSDILITPKIIDRLLNLNYYN